MNIEEKDPAQTIVAAGGRLGHVHLADSNRQYPGQGHINFAALISALRQIGYSAYLSGEMLNYPDPETCILEYRNYLKEITNG
jgi:sugar phosphate isomerase/epimerase